ncbi:MAG: smalltalk protein [Prevotella sp.]|nr:smalltalk protein [Prevotella sp.]
MSTHQLTPLSLWRGVGGEAPRQLTNLQTHKLISIPMKKFKTIIQFIITILTAITSSFFVQSCM